MGSDAGTEHQQRREELGRLQEAVAVTLPLLITVNGTGIPDPFGPGFSGDIGRAFAIDPWQAISDQFTGVSTPASPLFWQPIGYSAAVTPMAPSVAGGRAEVNRQIGLRPKGTPLFLSGYSQGAIVTGQVWALDILAPNGVHHERLGDVRGIINFGDPLRCPGIAHGNEVAGLPLPKKLDGQVTGGIAGPADLTAAQTPDFLLSCALDGDLYAAAPVGQSPWNAESSVGKVETNIYDIIQQPTFSDVISIAKDLGMPIGTVEAIYNALLFFGQGVNAAHWAYGPFVPAMVNWILSRI
jgi:hypothetical protein